jgi:hypothetical protein
MTDFRKFTDMLSDLNYPHLELTVEVYANVGHDPEGIALTYLHGLRSVYNRPSLTDGIGATVSVSHRDRCGLG